MKKLIIVVCVLILVVLLFPIRLQMNDGGTVEYKAILYSVYDVHRIKPADGPNEDGTIETEYIDGIIVEIFGKEVFNNTNPHLNF